MNRKKGEDETTPGKLVNTSAGYELESAVAANMAHPETFQIPSEEMRTGLCPGDSAKLLFNWINPDGTRQFAPGERMWVLVVRSNNGIYQGVAENTAVYSSCIVAGETWVQFSAANVADCIIRQANPLHPKYDPKWQRIFAAAERGKAME